MAELTDAVAHAVLGLNQARRDWREKTHRAHIGTMREFPSQEKIAIIASALSKALFPMRLGPANLHRKDEDAYVSEQLILALSELDQVLRLELFRAGQDVEINGRIERILQYFLDRLPQVRRLLDSDADAAFRGDPAAHSVDEVILSYPGLKAITYHRLANLLYQQEVPVVARMMSEIAHSQTGIDIHPGAKIGQGFFIDHGTGIVIGETTIIGNEVRLYQAVTLGAKRFAEQADGSLIKGEARHPIVEDEVVIYAGATILGRVTIGRGSVIGGNVWLTHSVPAGSYVSQARNDERGEEVP